MYYHSATSPALFIVKRVRNGLHSKEKAISVPSQLAAGIFIPQGPFVSVSAAPLLQFFVWL